MRRGPGWEAPRETIENATTDGFLAEAESFCDLVTHGWDRWTGVTPDESIDIAIALEALTTSARTGAAVVLPR